MIASAPESKRLPLSLLESKTVSSLSSSPTASKRPCSTQSSSTGANPAEVGGRSPCDILREYRGSRACRAA